MSGGILEADRGLEWHRAVAPGGEVPEITSHGLALSRLKHGFESRREGPKEVRSSLRRQSFSSDSKREVIAPALGRTRRGFAPATRQLREAEVACGEPKKGDCSPAGQGPPAFLPVGGARRRPPFPNQEGVEGRLPRPGDRRLGPHSSASPAGQRQKPGCAWLRGVPCSAAFCTLVCCKSARLLETWPPNPLPFIGVDIQRSAPRLCREHGMWERRARRADVWVPAQAVRKIRRCGRPGRIHENPARKPPASAVLAYSGATSGRDGGCGSPCDAGWGRRLRSRSFIPSRAT